MSRRTGELGVQREIVGTHLASSAVIEAVVPDIVIVQPQKGAVDGGTGGIHDYVVDDLNRDAAAEYRGPIVVEGIVDDDRISRQNLNARDTVVAVEDIAGDNRRRAISLAEDDRLIRDFFRDVVVNNVVSDDYLSGTI